MPRRFHCSPGRLRRRDKRVFTERLANESLYLNFVHSNRAAKMLEIGCFLGERMKNCAFVKDLIF